MTATSATSTPVYTPLAPAQAITNYQWREIAMNPAGHVGERIVVYGQVTQFDANAGGTSFRANVDAIVHNPDRGLVDYPTNTMFSGDAGILIDLVQGDTFKADATVAGANTYQNSTGGSLTVPQLTATKIVITSAAN
jgi:hypothetical protein